MPRNVVLLGVTSFFADVSSEMIYPLIPVFLTSTLGAPVATVGLIEGIAESTASLSKPVAGALSDRAGRRLPFVVSGYTLAAAGKLILAGATAWPVVLGARFVDRLGKGLRDSPRDALIGDSTTADVRGAAFGLHRAMDTGGAVLGPLIGLLLVALLDERLRLVFLIAAIPGFVSVLCLTLVKERRRTPAPEAREDRRIFRGLRQLDSRLKLFLLATLVFSLGNSSDAFLILRAKDLGLSTTLVIISYIVYNFVYMSAAFPAGLASDYFGRRVVFIAGLLIFAFVYGGLAIANDAIYIWPLFAIYGLYIALTDGVSRALISDLAPDEHRAFVLGLYGMLTGVATLLASLVAGQLWDRVGEWAPFAVGAAGALVSATLLGGAIAAGMPRKARA
ncbi:MAG TPA: MFS transporter [Dehalococcoidia bacterium]|nr:MFS transporter [Dehalococcoidia bacterium]